MRKYLKLLLPLLIMGLVVATCEKEKLEPVDLTIDDVFKLQQEKITEVGDRIVDLTQTLKSSKGKVITTGTLTLKNPNKFRYVLVSNASGQDIEQTTICDGATMWQLTKSPDAAKPQIVRFDLDKIDIDIGVLIGQHAWDLRNFMDTTKARQVHEQMKEQFICKVLGKTTLESIETYVFEMEPKETLPDTSPVKMIGRAKIWVGVRDGLQYRLEAYDKEGKLMMTQEMKNSRINTGISNEIFTYKPPPDMEVIDGSKMAEKQRAR